jgi:prophage antirepressor-like protein
VVQETHTTSLGSNEPLTYNEGKAVYINEPGLYSLIMHSKAPFAEEFQDMVYETILPSIRKYGSYHPFVNTDLTKSKRNFLRL